MSLIFTSIALIFVSIVICLLWKILPLWKKQQRSNTPGTGFFSIFRNRRSTLKELSKTVTKDDFKGDFFHFWIGPAFGMAAINPDAAKYILKNEKDFPKYPNATGGHFKDNLVSANGEDWKRHRTFVNSGFTTKAYNDYFPIFLQMTEKAISKMDVDAKNGDVDCHNWFSKFTLDLLGNAIFHHDFGRLEDKSSDEYDSYTKLVSGEASSVFGILLVFFPWLHFLPLSQVKRLHGAIENIKSLFNKLIKDRQNSDKKFGDILDNLVKSEGTLSQNELLSNLWIFFLAGHETTATALTYACMCLARYPDIQEKIYQEIQNTIGDNVPTLDDLSKLLYLDCFISETARVLPAAPFVPTRFAARECKYNNHVIPKNSLVAIYTAAIQKNPEFWPNPENFDPDRFSPENRKGRHHYAFLPFSSGPRQCIGNVFSLIEQRLFLTRLIQKFRVLPPKNSPLRNETLSFGECEPVPICLEQRNKRL